MGKLQNPPPVKLVIGWLAPEDPILDSRVRQSLVSAYGDSDSTAGPFDFTDSAYYEEEMGKELKKYFMAIEHLVPPESLPAAKETAGMIEEMYMRKRGNKPGRTVNIDPGYIAPGQFLLATTKVRPQRIHLRNGYYAELELLYRKGSLHPLKWTYADYCSEPYLHYLEGVYRTYKQQLKEYREERRRPPPRHDLPA